MNYEKKFDELIDQIKALRSEISDLKTELKAIANKPQAPVIINNPPYYQPYYPYWQPLQCNTVNYTPPKRNEAWMTDTICKDNTTYTLANTKAPSVISRVADEWENSVSNQVFMR